MKTSIAMAVYNGIRYIEEQLDSIRLQSMPADEVIITDDGSADGTYEYIVQYVQKYKPDGWRVVKNNTRLGYIKNFNKALAMCNGEIIFTCDQDDIWHRDKIRKIYDLMQKNDEIKVIASSIDFIDENGKHIPKKYIPYNMKNVDEGGIKKIEFTRILEKNFFPGCTMAAKKEIVEQYCATGNKDIAHDWAIAMLGAKDNGLAWYNDKLISYRIHPHNTVGLAAANKSRWEYIRHTVETWPEYCREFDKRVQYTRKYIYSEDMEQDLLSQIYKLNDLRKIMVLREKDSKNVVSDLKSSHGIFKRLKAYFSELYIFFTKLLNIVDSRGLIIDFIYVCRVMRG